MKTIKNYIIVFLFALLWHLSSVAQYRGGDASGAATENLSNTFCGIPAHFNAYFGGDNDTASVDELSNTACGIPPGFFAYMGGDNDGATVDELSATVCGIPPSFYAYMGGENDTAATDELMVNICPFPPSFYAYFGGDSSGFVLDKTAPVCPTQPPVASFTASATEICVGQSVSFTDTSTNIPSGWNWTFASGTPSTSTAQNPVVSYATAGTYTVTLTSANYNGTNTVTQTGFITVYAFPTVPTIVAANRCGSGTLTLSATASAGTLSWYADPTGGTALGTGTSYLTPIISTTTPYYVETIIGTCISARRLVTATINEIPVILSTTSGSRCGTGTVALSATASIGNFEWFANATGGSPIAFGSSFGTPNTLSTTSDYYVEAVNGTCRSGRVAVTATINPAVTVTNTSPGFICANSGQVVLGATASSGTLNWYNDSVGNTILGTGTSFTTPNITLAQDYWVSATDGTCTSTRVAVRATLLDTPLVTSTTQVTPICVSGSTTLTATSNYNGTNTWAWYDAPTGGTLLSTSISYVTPVISSNTTYYVATDRFGCTSPRTAIIATITPTPTITSTTPASRCGTGSVALSATASAGNITWWNAPTGGSNVGSGATYNTTSIATTTTYYVQTTNNSCVSTRTAVVATITAAPTITATTPASNCGSGTVTLGATASAGTLNWYAASTGGTSLGTGASFITPIISATTTYYVGANDGACTSARTAVIATINVTPGITAIGNNSRCGTGFVSLSATASAGNVVWYANATGGTALATSNSFTTPSISATTTYYAEAVNGSCASTTRTAVVATIDTLPTITASNPVSQCGSGSFVLNASSSGTLSWFANSTGGTALATGSSFTTPTINATTTYYVASTNGTCITTRTAITATITNQLAPVGTANQSFCANETVGQLATTGTNVNWYATATSTAILPNSTPLVSGSTYFATQTISGCESSTRLAVSVITGDCLGSETYNKLNGLKLFPNPVIDLLTVTYSDKISKIEITNMLGQYIDNFIINANETQIDMSRLSTGTYLIKVTANDISETFKVLKK